MSVAPEPYLSAYLAVLHHAALAGRHWAWANEPNEKLADLMDAIHNVPDLLNRWEECDEPCLRSDLLRFDQKWARSEGDVQLCQVLANALAKGK
jgi:hypothetical protein